ncbi:MAG: oxidoreductase [Actinomycetia bacterium]|nr:oxidoreductase [Actinomycetes bacterium]
MATDPLATLAALPNVAEASEQARSAVDALLWNRGARSMSNELARESTLAGAWCSAAFEGAEVLLPQLRTGSVDDSPMSRVAARTLAMYIEIPKVSGLIGTAPMQVLARLHATVVGIDEDTDLQSAGAGRPRLAEPVDPLKLGTAVAAPEIPQRLAGLMDLLTTPTQAPAIVVAGIGHAEVAAMQPFERGSGIVARSLTRCILRDRGLDPDGWTIPEAAMRMMGRTKYVNALRGYNSGTSEGVSEWLVQHAKLVQVGAQEAEKWVASQQS